MEFLSFDELYTEGLEIGKIHEIKVHSGVGIHGWMRIKAEVSAEAEQTILYGVESRQEVRLLGCGEVIFSGLLCEVSFYKKDEVRSADILLKTATCLMDVEKKSRSFQNTEMKLSELLSCILSDYQKSNYVLSLPDRHLGQLLIQYKETDWQFIKRVFSQYSAPIGSAISLDGINIYAGVPDLSGNFEYRLNAVRRNESEAELFKSYGVSRGCFVDYSVISGERHDIFSPLNDAGLSLAVRALDYELKEARLECRYMLRARQGILEYPDYPVALTGIALEGTILEVKGNLVRVHMDIDDQYNAEDCYWFNYATMSASLNGSGWHYMPEIGDRIRVEFPDRYAHDALVINSASIYDVPGSGEDSMGDPSVKYLSNQAGQKMSLGPSGIVITAVSSGINIDNGGTVSIWGSNEILIKASGKITIASEAVSIKGSSKVKAVNEAGSGAELQSDMKLTGTEVLIN